jgi:hypothetical protein
MNGIPQTTNEKSVTLHLQKTVFALFAEKPVRKEKKQKKACKQQCDFIDS